MDTTETKPWYLSTTIIGAGIAIASTVVHATGLPITDADINTIASAVTTIGGVVGSLMAIVGRFKATKKIG